MIIIDELLKAREAQGKPVRVGMLGAGFMGQGLTNQITNSVPGMRMVAVYNRKPQRAFDVFSYSGQKIRSKPQRRVSWMKPFAQESRS